MAQDLISFSDLGLVCKKAGFYLDPSSPVKEAVITHAHADHARPGSGRVHCTRQTTAFMQARYGTRAALQFINHGYHDPFEINGVLITFLPAGHMLGSVQTLVESEGTTYLFTGDYKLQDDPTCDSYEFHPADILVTETTFAQPGFTHPNPAEQIDSLLASIEHNCIIAAYGLGKAQRLNRMFSDHNANTTVFIHPDITPFHRIYESEGYHPGTWRPYAKRAFRNSKRSIYLVPPRVFTGYRYRHEYHLAFASGWDHLQRDGNTRLHISDHGDWNDLLQVIDKTGAKEVLTVHGDGTRLASHLEPTGIRVRCLT